MEMQNSSHWANLLIARECISNCGQEFWGGTRLFCKAKVSKCGVVDSLVSIAMVTKKIGPSNSYY